jgi:hypothetical protein
MFYKNPALSYWPTKALCTLQRQKWYRELKLYCKGGPLQHRLPPPFPRINEPKQLKFF